MKKKIRILSTLAILVGLYIIITATAPAGDDRPTKLPNALDDADHPKHVDRQLTSKLAKPSLPDKMLVYRRENTRISPEFVTNLSARLLRGAGLVKTRPTIYITEGSFDDRPFRIEVDRTDGSFTLEDRTFYDSESTMRNTGEFPDLEQSKKIATTFLKDHNLMPEDAYLRGVVDNTKGADVMSVGFGRRVNGVETWGAGSQIIVDIGSGGKVVHVQKAWPTLTPIAEYNLVKPEIAIQKLKDGEGVLYHGQKGEIVALKLVYYVSPTVQDYVQPCYYADCQDLDTGKVFYGVIDAIEAK